MKRRITLLILTISLAACGKKEKEPAETPAGPQSTEGQILKAVKENSDAANDRIRKIQENLDAIQQQ